MSEQPPIDENQDQTPRSAAEGGYIYHADIDPAYREMVVKNLWEVLKGNGVKVEDIELSEFNGETLEFIAATTIRLKSKTSDRRQAGKLGSAIVMDSAQAVRDAIEKEKHKITHSQDVIRRVKDIVLGREDKGFGLQNEWIKFPFLYKTYVVYEPCPVCRAQGKIQCAGCHGKGSTLCPRCNGSGSEYCGGCSGRQFIQGANGQKIICMQCSGTGRRMCSYCQQKRTIICSKCRGAQVQTCMQCNGHAHISHIFAAEIDGIANFDYDAEKLSSKVQTILQNLGKALPEHVEFHPVIMETEPEQDTIIIPYQIRMPLADLIFKIKEDKVGGLMYGTQGTLSNMPYFLEKIMAGGIKSLKEAGEGYGDVGQKLIKAGQYKTLRQIIIASSRFGAEKAKRAVLMRTPVGLSDDKCAELIEAADQALNLITRKPRQIAAGVGTTLASAGFAAHFYVLREPIMEKIPPLPHIGAALDMIVLAAGMGLAFYAVQFTAIQSTKKTLGQLMKEEPKNPKLGKTGKPGQFAIAATLGIFFLILASTLFTPTPPPEWLADIMHRIQYQPQ